VATLLALAPAALWYALAAAGMIDWPQASGPVGVTLGLIGAAIIVFEMALAPRKWLRGWRLGATKVWLRLHVWLGFAVLPMIVIHSGFAFGGFLSALTMVLFLIVIASGIWGLIMQQWLPKKLFDEIPNETVASQTDQAILKHRDEARQVVDELLTGRSHGHVASAKLTGPAAELEPYLNGGRSILASSMESERVFQRLRISLPDLAGPALTRLEGWARLRRQWDRQVRINFWLHNWLIVHLPLSVAMTGFMIVHAVMALKGW
jgi:hypothetical protein